MQADQTAQHKPAITLLSKRCVGAMDSSSLSGVPGWVALRASQFPIPGQEIDQCAD